MKLENDITYGPLSDEEGRLETLNRLCRILYTVHEKRIGWGNGPCDCICPQKPTTCWRSTGEALLWLEKLVEALPKGDATVQITERFQMGPSGEVAYHDLVVEPVLVRGGDR